MAGEVVRAAARLTGVPVMPGGIRGRATEHLAASSSARMPRPVAATVSSGEEGAGELMPRVVFHGAPTLEEAREATSELIVGLENIYPWSHYESGSSLSNSQVEPAEASSVSSEITMEPPVATTVYTAFRLLRESTVAQNVVASIACDPNVVNAVRQNQQLQEFLHSERRRWATSHSVTGAERLDMLPAPSIEYSFNDSESKHGGICFEDLLEIIKGMADMMKNLSYLLKNLFGGEGAKSSANGDHGAPGASAESSANGDHGTPGASAEHVIEASLLGLAIMVIMLIFLKRG